MRRLGVLVTILCALALAASAQASAGTLTGNVTGLPAGVSTEGVEAINARGEIGAVGTLKASGAYSLRVPAGVWVLAATAESSGGPLTALGPPVRIRSGRTSHAHPTGAKVQASAAADKRLKRGSVVTVDPIIIEDERNFQGLPSNLDYTAAVVNDLFHSCSSRGITFVDTSETFEKFVSQESKLSREGRLAVPFIYRPIKPQYDVDPDSGQESGNAAGVVTPEDVDARLQLSGAGSLSAVIQGPLSDETFTTVPDSTDILKVVDNAATGLASRMCG